MFSERGGRHPENWSRDSALRRNYHPSEKTERTGKIFKVRENEISRVQTINISWFSVRTITTYLLQNQTPCIPHSFQQDICILVLPGHMVKHKQCISFFGDAVTIATLIDTKITFVHHNCPNIKSHS